MSNLIEVKIPDIGGHSGVDVIEVFVKPGDSIKVDDALVTLETTRPPWTCRLPWPGWSRK